MEVIGQRLMSPTSNRTGDPDSPSGPIDLVIEGGCLITMDPDRTIIQDGFVAIDKGLIVGIGSGTATLRARSRIDAGDMVVLPGIVNAHDHLDQSLYRGCTDGHVNPRSVLLRLARGMTRERARAAASVTLLELLHHGVTTTHESHWTH
ncbi:MAG: hypothetical protein WB801_04730, partial [Candidatus Dormiibacterota bacterium]